MSTTQPEVPGSRPARTSAWGRRGWTWPRAAAAVLLMAAGVFATRDAWADIVDSAMKDQEQSHIFLVPVVAAWLFWVRRERLVSYVAHAHWIGPAVIALGWLLNAVGDSRNIVSFWHGGAIVVVVGGFLTVFGGAFVLRFVPAFVALAFLVPVPGRIRQGIGLPLQSATATVTQAVLETMGVSVERWGNMLRINQQDVMIAEACNGLRMVFALVMVSFAFSFGTPLRNSARFIVMAASPVTAILFNVARLVPTVWAYGVVSPDVASWLHDVSGWLMLPIAFLSLLGMMRLLRWAQIPITRYVLSYGY